MDDYGRRLPRAAHGTANLGTPTASGSVILMAVLDLFERIIDPELTARRVYVTAIRLDREDAVAPQLDLFTDQGAAERERRLQRAMLGLRKRYGKNVLLKGHDLQEGATTIQRNSQIGGHRA